MIDIKKMLSICISIEILNLSAKKYLVGYSDLCLLFALFLLYC